MLDLKRQKKSCNYILWAPSLGKERAKLQTTGPTDYKFISMLDTSYSFKTIMDILQFTWRAVRGKKTMVGMHIVVNSSMRKSFMGDFNHYYILTHLGSQGHIFPYCVKLK